LYHRQVVEVEVAGTRLPAMTYVGQRIRASVTQPSALWTPGSQLETCAEATTLTRRLRAPFADEH
jgi:hypothetical protein